jgi:hypothetical protein
MHIFKGKSLVREAITQPDHQIIKQHNPKPYQWQADVDIHALRKPSVPPQHIILEENQVQGEAITLPDEHNSSKDITSNPSKGTLLSLLLAIHGESECESLKSTKPDNTIRERSIPLT